MSFSTKILSMNIGEPEQMEWQGKQVFSSMRKRPTPGPLVVRHDGIDGNSFANASAHGFIENVLYAYGIPSALTFARRLGLDRYEPGSTGETLTLEEFNEEDISVGDIFEIGEVVAQATFPRIPCGKVNYRMQHEHGQQAMIDCGRSGVYFRILNPGLIHQTDLVRRTERSAQPFSIFRLYELILSGDRPTNEELEIAKQNPAFLQKQLKKWSHL